jgi:hypothetical protein
MVHYFIATFTPSVLILWHLKALKKCNIQSSKIITYNLSTLLHGKTFMLKVILYSKFYVLQT